MSGTPAPGGQAAGQAPAPAAAAPASGTPAPSAGTPNTGAGGEWTQGFSDDMKGYVANKGWKNAQEVADSYRNFEKNYAGVGQDRLLKLPESMEGPEARAMWERLGAPKTAAEYKIDPPADTKDPKTAEWLAGTFHELGVPKSMAEGFAKKANERIAAQMAANVENQKAANNLALTDLKTEWGAAFDKNMNMVDQAGKILGWDANKLNALRSAVGPKDALKMMLDVANSTSESKFISGKPAADGTVSPDQARAELQELYRDPAWVKKYTSGDFDARKRMERLQNMAAAGAQIQI